MDILTKLKNAQLRGRSGSGFPVYCKWKLVKQASGKKKYVIANGSEGEPGSFKDEYLLENYSEEVVEGVKIALSFLGAEKGYIYLRSDLYTRFRKKLEKIIGDNPIEVFLEPGGYLCGEETTLIETIEGGRPEPRWRPPYPPERGLWGCPTLVNNIETFYYVSQIKKGRYKKTRWVSILEKGKRKGVFEVPLSWSVEKILQKTGNYPAYDFFVQAGGGASGKILFTQDLKKPWLGLGAFLIYPVNISYIKFLRNLIDFFYNENCGKCVPCREGVYRLKEILDKARSWRQVDLRKVEDILTNLEEISFCGLGTYLPNSFRGIIKHLKSHEKKSKN